MSEVKVHLVGVEGEAERSVTETTTIGELFAGIFGQDRSAIAARVNGELRVLSRVVADGDEIEPVKAASEDGRAIIRHSTAHVLAQAVQDVFPDAKLGIGLALLVTLIVELVRHRLRKRKPQPQVDPQELSAEC